MTNNDIDMIRRIEDDLLTFRNHSLHFGKPTTRLRETKLQPVSWWEKYGNSAPTLVCGNLQISIIYDLSNTLGAYL